MKYYMRIQVVLENVRTDSNDKEHTVTYYVQIMGDGGNLSNRNELMRKILPTVDGEISLRYREKSHYTVKKIIVCGFFDSAPAEQVLMSYRL